MVKLFKFLSKAKDYEGMTHGHARPTLEDSIVLQMNELVKNISNLDEHARKWSDEKARLLHTLEELYKHCKMLSEKNTRLMNELIKLQQK
jgi:predicted transcriptional regulator